MLLAHETGTARKAPFLLIQYSYSHIFTRSFVNSHHADHNIY